MIIAGFIIAKEMLEALQFVGINFDQNTSLSLMKKFGVEKPGYMNLKEFIMLLDQVTKDVDQRRKNLSGQYIMTLVPIDNNEAGDKEKEKANFVDDTSIRDESGRNYSDGSLEIPLRYVPPSTGILVLKSMNSVFSKPLHKVGLLKKLE
jgi:hypothetical protein